MDRDEPGNDLSSGFGRTPEGFGRQLLFLLVLISWPVTAFLMWQQLWMLPDAEILRLPRMVRPPTMQAFTRETVIAAGEVLVIAALVWPRRRLYATRLLVAAAALPVWFLVTVPRGLTTVDQVHRRAVAALILLLWISLVTLIVWRIARRLGRAAD
jgi:hypothetical protein